MIIAPPQQPSAAIAHQFHSFSLQCRLSSGAVPVLTRLLRMDHALRAMTLTTGEHGPHHIPTDVVLIDGADVSAFCAALALAALCGTAGAQRRGSVQLPTLHCHPWRMRFLDLRYNTSPARADDAAQLALCSGMVALLHAVSRRLDLNEPTPDEYRAGVGLRFPKELRDLPWMREFRDAHSRLTEWLASWRAWSQAR